MREIRVVKSHGTGNDFVLFADLSGDIGLGDDDARSLCDRHFGIGGDGAIRIGSGDRAPFFMDYRNADGSLAEMCGNGIRCVAKYVFDRGLTDEAEFDIETRAGVKRVRAERGVSGLVSEVEVDMGPPIFDRSAIPVAGAGDDALHEKVSVDAIGGGPIEVTAVSMGNPHAVVFVDDVVKAPVESAGSEIERLVLFPNGTNVEFVQVKSDSSLAVRIWERGVGETLSCGTGACAAVAASAKLEKTGREVELDVPGGHLSLSWNETMMMTGPAVEVFETVVDLDSMGRPPGEN